MNRARWPLHPAPGELESLSSWLARIAAIYGVRLDDLLGPQFAAFCQNPDLLDEDPPPGLLGAVSRASGVPTERLGPMTMPAWVPLLFDSVPMPERYAEQTFYTYVRQYSVLLAPGEATRFEIVGRRSWRGPWMPATRMERSCPLCIAEPEPRRSWIWGLPLAVGCTLHRRRLFWREELLRVEVAGLDVVPIPIPEPFATLENYTHQALTTRAVALPGRCVHAGVWFRLLRTLLDELSLSPNGVRAEAARTLAQVWEAAEVEPRAGVRLWQPYERLPWPHQQDLLTAAAVALDLAARGRIRPRGSLAALLAAPQQHNHPGEPPPDRDIAASRLRLVDDTRCLRRPAQFRARVDELAHAVRTDPESARQVLAFLIRSDPSPANLERERDVLIRDAGMPPDFVRTRAETEAMLILYGHDPGEIARAITEFSDESPLRAAEGPAAELFTPEDLAQLRARLEP
ncbi:TniQ family protein [Nocardia sp. NPDC004260]